MQLKYWSESFMLLYKRVNRFSPIIYSFRKYCNNNAVGMSYVILAVFFSRLKELNDYFNRLFPGATGTTMARSTI